MVYTEKEVGLIVAVAIVVSHMPSSDLNMGQMSVSVSEESKDTYLSTCSEKYIERPFKHHISSNISLWPWNFDCVLFHTLFHEHFLQDLHQFFC